MILEFPAFVLIGVYSPATRDDTRTDFRLSFLDALDARVRNLVALGKEVVLAGDLNIMRSELDTAVLQERLRKENMTLNEFFSMPSRRFLNHLVFGGRVIGERDKGRAVPVMWDLCREFNPSRQGMFTCWETKKNARPANFGSRIDYVLCTSGIKDWFVDANIQEGLMGSDHCPVYATLNDFVKVGGRDVSVLDVMNPPGMFEGGTRLRDWAAKDLLPTSAKLIPEFDKRRSIKDMFFTKGPQSKKDPANPRLLEREDTEAEASEANRKGSTSEEQAASFGLASSSLSTELVDSSVSTNSFSNAGLAPKRAAESSNASNRPQKKTKAAMMKDTSSKARSSLSQSSLTGFFKPKNQDASLSQSGGGEGRGVDESVSKGTVAVEDDNGIRDSVLERSCPDTPGDEKIFDAVQNKESWSKLLGKRVAPRCEHNEPCVSFVTKKPGVNCGEQTRLPSVSSSL